MQRITNFYKTWLDYKKSKDYKTSSEALKAKGIKQPYRDNILMSAFDYIINMKTPLIAFASFFKDIDLSIE